jgi:ribosomal-protein-alanine N-acetyltransferase
LHSPAEITTSRLRLVPVTPLVVNALFRNRKTLCALIGATVPGEWPVDPVIMEILREQLNFIGALAWKNFVYVSKADLTAIGDGGFKGRTDTGSAEIGYSVIPLFRGKGLATEAARALLAQAFSDNRLKFVKAETSTGNPKSGTVLRKIGMSEAARGIPMKTGP